AEPCGERCHGADMATLVHMIRINMPNVQDRWTEYVYIRFRSGDQLTIINAGGCVQTGGFGPHTWKRYVNPDPSDMYYGRIQLPGLPEYDIRDIIGRMFIIPAGPLPIP